MSESLKQRSMLMKNISLEVLSKKQLESKGLGLHLAVNQGSKKEPKLIIVKYRGAAAKDGYTALVGKGLTFDTGGLNLKPTGHIETMRMDMGGAASVVGVLHNAIKLKLKKNILFVMGMAENAIGPEAFRNDDILTMYSGKTVEVNNCDAEGRLVLGDGVAHASKHLNPSLVIDMATLTGAQMVATGKKHASILTNKEELESQAVAAGLKSG